MSMRLDVSKLVNKLDNIANSNLQNALELSAILVENTAKSNCPVDTGLLRNSITHEVSPGSAEIGTNVEYAPYVEFGTGLFAVEGDGRQTPWVYLDSKGEWHYTTGQLPQPFLEPALTYNTDAIIDIFKNELTKGVSK